MPSDDDSALQFRMSVVRLARRMRRVKAVDEVPDGQLSVVAALYDEGPSTPRALAEREDVSPPAMNRIVNLLERRGFVRRVAHPDDGRSVLVEITDAGRRLVRETRRRRDAQMETELAALTPDERAVLARAADLMDRMWRR